ncbi:MAG: peroxiredoxin [Acidobacteria bacterium]|nr:peroxiredoxin [Acidobacteriota bacterium]
MTVQIGDSIPSASLGVMTPDGPSTLTTDEIFAGKRVVLFAVPGAFTPTCSDRHLPGFLENAAAIRRRGVDTLACLAVNDVFVMSAWGEATGAAGTLQMLADGNGDLARALGLEADFTQFGMGHRSRRYAAIVDDGVVRWLGVETAPGVRESSADAALAALDALGPRG